MLDVKKLIEKLLHIAEPTTLIRPLSTDQKTGWTWTAPHNGILYLNIITTTRVYCSIQWNGNYIGDFAYATTSPNQANVIPILCAKGDVIKVTNLSASCYLLGRTSFISMGGVAHRLLKALKTLASERRWVLC